jgi:hypothetical protein
MISGADGRHVVGLDVLQQWLIDRCGAGVFHCATRQDPELADAVAATGLPVERVEILVERRVPVAHFPVRDHEFPHVRARPVPATLARAALGELPPDFLMVDDTAVLRLAYDDHDRLVVGFVEPERATDRYRLTRDVLWEAADAHGFR